VLGDLWEEYAEVADAYSPSRARRWYWQTALRISLRYGVEAPRRALRSPGASSVRLLIPGRWSVFAGLGGDLRCAARAVLRRPSTAAVAVLTLGIGIGASTTIFAVFDAVVLNPLPHPEPDRLVVFQRLSPQGWEWALSEPEVVDFRERGRGVVELAPVRPEIVTVLDRGEPVQVRAIATTDRLFRILQAEPVLGRGFTAGELRPGGDSAVLVMSHDLWQSRFGSDPDVVGSLVRLADGDRTVVGVMPPRFDFPGDVSIWIPFVADPAASRGDRRLFVYGRLRPDVSVEQARGEMRVIAASLAREYPASSEGWGVRTLTLPEAVVGPDVEQITSTLLSAVGLLLLLACTNTSNLLMARATTRRREIGVRAAIGAGRARVVRQLLAESFLVAFVGAGVGLVLVFAAIPVVVALPELLPRLHEVSVDGTELVFAAVVAGVAGLLCGLAPAAQAGFGGVQDAISETGASAGRAVRRFRDALVVGQIAIAMVLMVGAGLLTNSFLRLRAVDAGFETAGLLTVSVDVPPRVSAEGVVTFYGEAIERVAGLSGVDAVAGVNMRLFDLGPRPHTQLAREGTVDPDDFVLSDWRAVTDDYFRTMGLSRVSGRFFERSDGVGTEPVVVVNQALADALWPDGEAVGQRIRWDEPSAPKTVVGVVADFRDVHPALGDGLSVFIPHSQVASRDMTLLIRSRGDEIELRRQVHDEIRAAGGEVTISPVTSAEERLHDLLWRDRFPTLLVGIFAAVATLLASLGCYGIVTFSVARRTREIGVRIALGAHPTGIVAMLFAGGYRLVVAGIALGVLGSLPLAPLLGTLLYEVPPTDAWTYLAAGTLLCAVSALAVYIPAGRATAVDPTDTLASV
jgi:putative ABC transport system permease protein